MRDSMTTTAFALDGSLQTLLGGNISLFTELCEKTRAEAFEMMVVVEAS
jgi:hypothetical protein